MMIAISIFLLVVVIGMGALLNANLAHHKSANLRSVLDNLSFTMEDMANNLRTGYSYHCINDTSGFSDLVIPSDGNCWGIAFEYQDGNSSDPTDQWVYYVDGDGKLMKTTEAPYNSLTIPNKYYQLTPNEVTLFGETSFIISGTQPNDDRQPYVIIRLVGNIKTPRGGTTPFSLQTSVTQRFVDVP